MSNFYLHAVKKNSSKFRIRFQKKIWDFFALDRSYSFKWRSKSPMESWFEPQFSAILVFVWYIRLEMKIVLDEGVMGTFHIFFLQKTFVWSKDCWRPPYKFVLQGTFSDFQMKLCALRNWYSFKIFKNSHWKIEVDYLEFVSKLKKGNICVTLILSIIT